MVIEHAHVGATAEPWATFWRPCRAYFEIDRRLVHRLVQLKKTWVELLRNPWKKLRQVAYCWRYFGLLHHTLRIAKQDLRRGDALPVLRRIIGFESFPIEIRGGAGVAAGALSIRNPLYVLGRLQHRASLPTPRHVPLVVPPGHESLFYSYRRLTLSKNAETSLLAFPAVDLAARAHSFAPIDRMARLLTTRPDPYAQPRARLLARRALVPLARAHSWAIRPRGRRPMSILDLGSGTGHFTARAWQGACRDVPALRRAGAMLHFVDAAGPCFGRSFGVSRDSAGTVSVEWTTADYRSLLDDDSWLRSNGPFDWVFVCRVLGNVSNIGVEDCGQLKEAREAEEGRCNPATCLAPRRLDDGLNAIEARTVHRAFRGGVTMPQLSLAEYFGAIRAVQSGTLDAISEKARYLPVRRFNPAALITPSGRSVLGQLLRVASAIIVEDLDLSPEQLVAHKQQFGMEGSAGVQFVDDGFNTEARHYVITAPAIADRLPGRRLW